MSSVEGFRIAMVTTNSIAIEMIRSLVNWSATKRMEKIINKYLENRYSQIRVDAKNISIGFR